MYMLVCVCVLSCCTCVILCLYTLCMYVCTYLSYYVCIYNTYMPSIIDACVLCIMSSYGCVYVSVYCVSVVCRHVCVFTGRVHMTCCMRAYILLVLFLHIYCDVYTVTVMLVKTHRSSTFVCCHIHTCVFVYM